MKIINPLSSAWFDHCLDYADTHGVAVGCFVWLASILLPTVMAGLALVLVVYLAVQFPLVAAGVAGVPVLIGGAWLGRHMVRAIRSWGAR